MFGLKNTFDYRSHEAHASILCQLDSSTDHLEQLLEVVRRHIGQLVVPVHAVIRHTIELATSSDDSEPLSLPPYSFNWEDCATDSRLSNVSQLLGSSYIGGADEIPPGWCECERSELETATRHLFEAIQDALGSEGCDMDAEDGFLSDRVSEQVRREREALSTLPGLCWVLNWIGSLHARLADGEISGRCGCAVTM